MEGIASRGDWQQALAAYVEPLAVDRRVAVLGDASAGLVARVAELGARSVFVWDPDAERAREEAGEAPHGVVVRPLFGQGDPGMQRGAFDLAIVPDLTLFDDVEGVLARVRRLVGDEGAALFAAPNGNAGSGGLDYYELFDLVARQFEHVTMIAQLPFRGVALAELGGEGEPPAVTVDMQFGDRGKAPEAFVALASQSGILLDPYAIIELPPPETQGSVVDEAMRVALEQARLRIPSLEASLQAMHERVERGGHVEATLAQRTGQVLALTEELERMRESLETARFATAKIDEMVLRADRAEAAQARVEGELARVSEVHALERGRYEGEALRDRETVLRANRAEAALARVEGELGRVTEVHALELGRYEEALRDRAQATRALEAEVARRDRMVEDLVDALQDEAPAHRAEAELLSGPERAPLDVEAPRPPSEPMAEAGPGAAGDPQDAQAHADAVGRCDVLSAENARLRGQLDALALELARREGDSQATAWTIAELEGRLESVARAAPQAPAAAGLAPDSGDADRLATALDELDVLRQALAQEHDARQRAESGEELAQARAEIQRQAALLDELRDRSA